MTVTHVQAEGTAPSAPRRIGEVARLVGVSPSALRVWERQGLVHPRRTDAGYRVYSNEDLRLLRRVRELRRDDRLNAPGIRRVMGAAQAPRRDGDRLRVLRHQHGFTLRDAAARSGLSMSQISAIERGASSASVTSMQRLTSAYGATVADLLEPMASVPRRVVRAGKRPALELANAAVRIEHLGAGHGMLEPQLFRIGPGATSEGSYAHEGEEFLFVIAGAVTVWVGERERYRLNEGDALSFPSTMPHRWRNHASGETRLLWINTPPTF
jgi:DNA-binding transcriptional MerR regulator/quercetin dioxygenase-like cupin family protein